MKSYAAALQAHFRGDVATLALCWRITKSTGETILGTDHDRDLTIADGDLAGTYQAGANISGSDVVSSSDLSVDNSEVQGAFPDSLEIQDVTVAEMESGVLDNAPVVAFFVNWADPDAGQVYIRRGFLGTFERDSDGKYRTELRGLSQLLAQTIVQTYSEKCNVRRFGDARCGFDVSTLAITVTVQSVTTRGRFAVTGITSQAVGFFNGGTIVGASSANSGMVRQVRNDSYGGSQGILDLFEAFPLTVAIGDTFTLSPGCNRTRETCRDTFNNLANFRGYGVFIPGALKLLAGPVSQTRDNG